MVTALVWPGPQRMEEITPEALRGTLTRADGFLWLDLDSPGEDDRALLREALGFHPLALEDAFRARERPKLDIYPDHYFIVFYALAYDPADGLRRTPVHFFVGPRYLVTVHPEAVPEIEEVAARWGGREPLGPVAPGSLVYALLDALLDRYFPILDRIAEEVEAIEERLFGGSDGRLIEGIFRMRKALLELRRVVAPEREVINLLLRRELPVFRAEDMVYFQDLYDRLVRLTESIDLYRDMLSGALESYLSLQSNRLNEIVKVLTIASIILMADALVAGIYGMNFRYMPELEWPWGYPMALLLMAGVSVGLALFFRRRGWL